MRALITGASGGFGAEFAKQLSERGYQLTLTGRNKSKLKAVAESLSAGAETLICDMADLEQLKSFCAEIEAGEPFDLLVSSAGFVEPKPLHLSSYREIDQHIMVNQLSAMHVTRAVLPAMVARGSGKILMVSSMGGIVALENYTSYSSAKFALRGFLWSLAQEMKGKGVDITGIYPAGVDTPMLRAEARNEHCSPLNFLGKVSKIEDVIGKAMASLDKPKLEVYVPYGDSWTSRILGFFPSLLIRLGPSLNGMGKKGHKKYLEKIGSE